MVCHAGDVGKLPLRHRAEGRAEAPHLRATERERSVIGAHRGPSALAVCRCEVEGDRFKLSQMTAAFGVGGLSALKAWGQEWG